MREVRLPVLAVGGETKKDSQGDYREVYHVQPITNGVDQSDPFPGKDISDLMILEPSVERGKPDKKEEWVEAIMFFPDSLSSYTEVSNGGVVIGMNKAVCNWTRDFFKKNYPDLVKEETEIVCFVQATEVRGLISGKRKGIEVVGG